MTPARRLTASFSCLAAGHLFNYSPLFSQWLPSLGWLNSLMSARVWKAVVHLNSLFNNCFPLLFVCCKIKPNKQKKKKKKMTEAREAAWKKKKKSKLSVISSIDQVTFKLLLFRHRSVTLSDYIRNVYSAKPVVLVQCQHDWLNK